ncbi:UNVERIFIED_ORG: S1-C subfamily serine protease [Bacillus sp. 1751]|nr:S1-C subfamily serine protease [Bacillus sp. 1751]
MINFESIVNAVFTVARITPTGVKPLGTATLLNKVNHIVTAAHITEHDDNNLVIIVSQNKSLSDYQDTVIKDIAYANVKIVAINPLHDLCILKIDENEGNISARIGISGLDQVNVGDKVTMFGFPDLNFGKMVLTQQETQIGAKILLENSGEKVKHAVVNLQSRKGQSGSAVFDDSLNIVGILVGSYVPHNGNPGIEIGGIDPLTLHPTTHIVSAEYIREMLNDD